MRLPTKRDYASTSMREAKRAPVLQDKNFVKAQAAQQRFYGVDPSAYMTLGNAQARAATAQGNVGLAMGTAALKVDAAVQKVDDILQTTAANAAISELQDWSATYSADLSNRDLTEFDGEKYAHESVASQRDKDYKNKVEELRKKHKFSNALINSEFSSKASGIKTALSNRTNELVRNAEVNIGQSKLLEQFSKGFTSEKAVNDWIEGAAPYYDAKELEEFRIKGMVSVEGANFKTIFENVKTDNRALNEVKDGEIRKSMEGNTLQSQADINAHISQINRQIDLNVANAEVALDQAQDMDQLNDAYAKAMAAGNFAGAGQPNVEPYFKAFEEKYQKNVDRILLREDKTAVRLSTGALVVNKNMHMQRVDKAVELVASGTLSDEGEETLRKSIVDDAAEFWTNRVIAGMKWDRTAAQVVADLAQMSPEDLHLFPGSLATDHLTLINKLEAIASNLDKQAALKAEDIDLRTSEEQLGFDMATSGLRPPPETAKGSIDYAWEVFKSESIRSQKEGSGYVIGGGAATKKNTMQLLEEFVAQTGGIPTSMAASFNAALSHARGGKLREDPNILTAAVDAMSLLHHYNNISGGTFLSAAEDGHWAIDNANAKMAIELQGRLKSAPVEQQQEIIADYLLAEQGRRNVDKKAEYGKVGSEETRTALFNEVWAGIQEANSDLPDLTDQFIAASSKIFEDIWYSVGGNSDSGKYAATLAIGRMLEETFVMNGELGYGEHPLNTNIHRSPNRVADDNNPVWASIKQISEKAGVEPEELQFIRDGSGEGYLIYLNGGASRLEDEAGNPVIFWDDEVTEWGQVLRSEIDTEAKVSIAEEQLEATINKNNETNLVTYDAELRASTTASGKQREIEDLIGSEKLQGAELDAALAEHARLGEEAELEMEVQIQALEEAKERRESDDYATRKHAEAEVARRQTRDFINASPEMQEEMLDDVRVKVNGVLQAEAERAAATEIIEDPVESAKDSLQKLRDEVRRRKEAEKGQ